MEGRKMSDMCWQIKRELWEWGVLKFWLKIVNSIYEQTLIPWLAMCWKSLPHTQQRNQWYGLYRLVSFMVFSSNVIYTLSSGFYALMLFSMLLLLIDFTLEKYNYFANILTGLLHFFLIVGYFHWTSLISAFTRLVNCQGITKQKSFLNTLGWSQTTTQTNKQTMSYLPPRWAPVQPPSCTWP